MIQHHGSLNAFHFHNYIIIRLHSSLIKSLDKATKKVPDKTYQMDLCGVNTLNEVH